MGMLTHCPASSIYNGLDHTVAATTPLSVLTDQLHQQPVICHINKVLRDGHSNPLRDSGWHQYPLSCYRQLWSQLCLNDGIVCQKYSPSPAITPVLVPLIPETCHATVLSQHHDSVSAAHLGVGKTTAR